MQPVVNWPGWEFIRKLGSGSYGAVYEIRQQIGPLERRAALKVIPVPRDETEWTELHSQGYDDDTIERSLQEQVNDVVREFSVMLELRGAKNVVSCDEIRCLDRPKGKDVCIQMELLTPLIRSLKPGQEEAQALCLGRDILRALSLCREKKIVHRDIKPQNIFVSDDGDYKLGDFGVAKTMDRTGSATMIGTLNYMAPEVRNGEHYGALSDVYSLGLVLYWMLNERHLPFVPILDRPPKQSEIEQAASRRFHGESVPLPANGSILLKRTVCSMCAPLPAHRPDINSLQQTFDQLLSKLHGTGKSQTNQSNDTDEDPADKNSNVPEKEVGGLPDMEEGTAAAWRNTSKNTEKKHDESSEHAIAFKKSDESDSETGEETQSDSSKYHIHAAPDRSTGEATETEQAENKTAHTARQEPGNTQAHEKNARPSAPGKKKKWRTAALAAAAVCGLLVFAFLNFHDYSEATCTAPKTCKICRKTEGKALGHTWIDATCTEPETCSRCGETRGEPNGHDWVEATCTTSKYCKVCKTIGGGALGHDVGQATYDKPGTCSRCGLEFGMPKGWNGDVASEWSQGEDCFVAHNLREHYLKLETPVRACFRIYFYIGFDSDQFSKETWELYARDLNGNWSKVGSFEVDEGANVGSDPNWSDRPVITIDFPTDMSIDALGAVPASGARRGAAMWLVIHGVQTRLG